MTIWSFIADMSCVLHGIEAELIYNYNLHDWQFRRVEFCKLLRVVPF